MKPGHTTPRVLGIGFSPREKGNSDLLLEGALKTARENGARTKKLMVREYQVQPCLGCRSCEEYGECIQKDDFKIFEKELERADILIISTPVFFLGVPGKAKGLIDRFQSFWARKYLLDQPPSRENRPALLLICAGSDSPDIFEPSLRTIRAFLEVAGFKLKAKVEVKGVDEKGAVKEVKGLKEKVSRGVIKLLKASS